ncbi:MAG: hypothetical protein E6R08_11020 [Nevskiaceae bacterium]|nr:MAG: hypothetical protein E6R08_11020 [Nevskiaceae bacterium]
MATKARIQNGTVVEVLTLSDWEGAFTPALAWIEIPEGQDVRPGWLYDGAFHEPPGLTPLLPLSARQIRLALAQASLLDQVEAAIAAAPQADRIEWEYATTYGRDHPLIAAIGQTLGLTESQIDEMWRQAETL